jgi:hypothetical protein
MSRHKAGRLVSIALAALMLPCPVFADTPRGASTIEAASPGAGYDYLIHVQNTYDYKYNPEVREDRLYLARQIVKPFCSKSQIVGEDRFKTEIFGIKPGKPDYVVYVKCLSKPRALHEK